jgi:hypothetical protein
MNKETSELKDAISVIHQWKWMIMGGAAVISALISAGVHMPGIQG